MIDYVLVAAGSAAGGVARYALALAAERLVGNEFPWGTLLINILGSFVIGWFGALSSSGQARLFVMVGLCGGFTTFSAFSLQTLTLARNGQAASALLYIATSIVLCLAAVTLGAALGGGFGQAR